MHVILVISTDMCAGVTKPGGYRLPPLEAVDLVHNRGKIRLASVHNKKERDAILLSDLAVSWLCENFLRVPLPW